MKRPLTLPIVRTTPATTPTVDAAREQLGGRAETGPRTGELVLAGGTAVVIVHDAGDEVWVWIGEGRLKKVPSSSLIPLTLSPPPELARVAADARVFAGMREGERVRWVAADAELREGTLIEKCRFGALVAPDTGAIIAVAFRRLWPLARAEG